jgi:hypothetical protein
MLGNLIHQVVHLLADQLAGDNGAHEPEGHGLTPRLQNVLLCK